jgi:hypothetical protein
MSEINTKKDIYAPYVQKHAARNEVFSVLLNTKYMGTYRVGPNIVA